MKITICGLAGTGTSTLGKELAATLGYDYFSSGDAFRAKAAELGMSLNEFEQLCQRDEQYDKAIDGEVERYGQQNDDFVVESRLAWHFIPDSIKLKLTCDDEIRMQRLAERDGIAPAEAIRQTREREQLIRERYYQYYGIDQFDDDSHFDIILDSTSNPVDILVSQVRTALFPQ